MNKNKVLAFAGAALLMSSSSFASHSWNDYHWARTTSSFNLQVVDSVSAEWQSELNTSLQKWSQSGVLNLVITSSDDSSRTRKRCPMVEGQMRVCNAEYGNNGWAGLASINLDSNGHIRQGTAKMNDTYSMSQEFMNHVMCQEVGHVFGLGHTSEDGSSQKTCMDYSNDVNSQWPNSHDYQQLQEQYGHLDSYNSYSEGGSGEPCHGGPKKCGDQNNSGFGLGHKVHSAESYEVWVQPEADGTITVHHVYLIDGHHEH